MSYIGELEEPRLTSGICKSHNETVRKLYFAIRHHNAQVQSDVALTNVSHRQLKS